jgi:hypothetical protein
MNAPFVCLAAALLTGCAIPLRSPKLPSRGEAYVAVLSGEMPGALSQVARHSWIVVNVPAVMVEVAEEPLVDVAPSAGKVRMPKVRLLEHAGMHRFELQTSGSDPFEYFGTGDVAVHGVIHYGAEELEHVLACLENADRRYHQEHPDYFPIPGPNSNTLVDALLRECDIPVELPATAIGRDYRGLVGASVTSRGSGVQLETVVAGAKLGFAEGVEVHLFDLALGVQVWPPALVVPVNPGVIGFEDAGHRPALLAPWKERRRRRRRDRVGPRDSDRQRQYGIGSFYLYSRYARVVDPEDARGASDLATVGVEARGSYGRRLGYGMGLDLEAGVGLPLGFAYAARLYPLGLTLMLDDNTFVGAFVGIGSDSVGGSVPAAFAVPAELRLEADLGDAARWGVAARSSLWSGAPSRRGRELFRGLDDELVLSTFARLGTADPCGCPGHLGRGYFFALERGVLLGSAFLGLKFGIEGDFGL